MTPSLSMTAIGAHDARQSFRKQITFLSHMIDSRSDKSCSIWRVNTINPRDDCSLVRSISRQNHRNPYLYHHQYSPSLSNNCLHHDHSRRYLSDATNNSKGVVSTLDEDEGRGQPPKMLESSSAFTPVKISMDELLALASCQPTALSLETMYKYAPRRSNLSLSGNNNTEPKYVDIDRLRNSQFLHKELPIRIAQRAVDLFTLPHGLNRTREVQSVANTYLQYLQQLRQFPMPTNAETEREFTNTLKEFILDRHSIPMAISRGLQRLKDDKKAPEDARRLAEMEEALTRFFTARVGLRFLVEHHVLSGNGDNSDTLYRKQLEAEGGLDLLDQENYAILEDESNNQDNFCGAIQKNCDPVKEVKRTVARVTKLCRESYGIAPEIGVVDCTPEKDAGILFTYVPHHLRYMLAELLKNSCRATVKKCVVEIVCCIFMIVTSLSPWYSPVVIPLTFAAVSSYLSGANTQKEDHTKHHHNRTGGIHDAPSLPPIKVVVTKGEEDVTIKIADRGGGMPRSLTNRIWTFAHSTLNKENRTREDEYDFGRNEFTGSHIRGFGLPMTRIYARYFGGEVTIKSLEGYGVDAYLYLPVLGVACENLPQRVIRSPGNLDSSYPSLILDGDGYYDDFYDDSSVRQFDATTDCRKSFPVLDKLDERAL